MKKKNIRKYKHDELYSVVSVLPQNVQSLFTAGTVALELEGMGADSELVDKVSERLELNGLRDSHPYDLSGGEQQRLALAKVLLRKPEIFILDEPTKGMDTEFKKVLADIIAELKAQGSTIVAVSHDIEFCARYADRCAMFFDKEITTVAKTRRFFNENRFYTTAANRMSRGITDGAIIDEDVIKCIKEN